MLEVGVWVRRCPLSLRSTPARLQAKSKRAPTVAGPIAVQPARQCVISPIELAASQRTVLHLRTRLLRSKLHTKLLVLMSLLLAVRRRGLLEELESRHLIHGYVQSSIC